MQMKSNSKVRNYLHLNVNGLLLGTSETREFNTVKEKSAEKQGNQVQDKCCLLQTLPRTNTKQEGKENLLVLSNSYVLEAAASEGLSRLILTITQSDLFRYLYFTNKEEKYSNTEKLPSMI